MRVHGHFSISPNQTEADAAAIVPLILKPAALPPHLVRETDRNRMYYGKLIAESRTQIYVMWVHKVVQLEIKQLRENVQ